MAPVLPPDRSRPMRRVAVAISFSSSGEWTAPSPRSGARNSFSTSAADPFISFTTGRVIRMKTSIGPATASAMRSVRCSASDLGTISPSRTSKYVISEKAIATAVVWA